MNSSFKQEQILDVILERVINNSEFLDEYFQFLKKIEKEKTLTTYNPEYYLTFFILGIFYLHSPKHKKIISYKEIINDYFIKVKPIKEKKYEHIYIHAQFEIGYCYCELGQYEKAINFLKEVPKNHNLYFKSKFGIGYCYLKMERYEEAIKFFKNIQLIKAQNEDIFFDAQFYIGFFYLLKKDYEKSISYFKKIPEGYNLYFYAQYYIGCYYDEIRKYYEEAIKCFKNIQLIESQNEKMYYDAQYNIGCYYDEIKKYYEAIDYFKQIKLIKNQNEKMYYDAQYNIGRCYFQQREQKSEYHQKVIDYFKKIPESHDLYFNAQYNIGFCFIQINKCTESIVHFKNVKDFTKDNGTNFFQAKFYLILIDSKNITEHYNSFKNYKFNIESLIYSFYSYIEFLLIIDKKFIKNKIKILRNILQHILKEYILKRKQEANIEKYFNKKSYYFNVLETYFNLITKIKKDKFLIDEIVSKLLLNVSLISSYLFVKEEKVSHYTSYTATKDKFLIDKSEFKLNLANFMNDPKEGKVLSDFLEFDVDTNVSKEYAFLASFSLNINNLNLFRLYGKDDNKDEGTGLSLVLESFFSTDNNSMVSVDKSQILFLNNAGNEDENNNEKESLEHLQLYRCIYVDPKSGYINIAKQSKNSFYKELGFYMKDYFLYKNCKNEKFKSLNTSEIFQKYIKFKEQKNNWKGLDKTLESDYNIYQKDINIKLNNIKDILYGIKSDLAKTKRQFFGSYNENRQCIEYLIKLILLPIRFLVKHSSFEEEAECRIIYPS